jgi:hypothetical protein
MTLNPTNILDMLGNDAYWNPTNVGARMGDDSYWNPPAGSGQQAFGPATPGTNPYLTKRDEAIAAYLASLGQAQPRRQMVRPVRPAFRFQDALLGLLPTIGLAAAGQGDAAGQWAGNYLGGKMFKANQDTEFNQANADYDWQNQSARDQAMREAMRARIGFAGDDIRRWDDLEADRIREATTASRDAAAEKKFRFTQAQKYHDDAFNPNVDPSFRVVNAQQAMALLKEFTDDPVATSMVANLAKAMPTLEKESLANTGKRLSNERLQKVVDNMDQDIRDRHESTMARIAAHRANVAIAVQMGDLKFFTAFRGMYDQAIGEIDEQFKRYQKISDDTGLDEAQGEQLRALNARRNQLVAERDAVPMPGFAPGSGLEANTDPGYAPVGSAGGLTGGIGGGTPPRGLPVPKGGVDMSKTMTDPAAKAKATQTKATADAETKRKEGVRKSIGDIDKAIMDLEADRAAMDPVKDKDDIASIDRELATRREQKRKLVGAPAPKKKAGWLDQTLEGVAKQTSKATAPTAKSKVTPAKLKELREMARKNLEKYKDPAQQKAIKDKFKELAGIPY